MYGIFTYIWLIFMVNEGEYTIHGCYRYKFPIENQPFSGKKIPGKPWIRHGQLFQPWTCLKTTWNAKCPIFLGNFTPTVKPATIDLKIGHLAFQVDWIIPRCLNLSNLRQLHRTLRTLAADHLSSLRQTCHPRSLEVWKFSNNQLVTL